MFRYALGKIGCAWAAWGDVLYPPHCLCCFQSIDWAHCLLCKRCWCAIEDNEPTIGGQSDMGWACSVAWGAFEGPLREAIHALKFGGKRRLGRALGHRMARALTDQSLCLDGLVALPLHAARQRERGYNQSADIAQGLAEGLGIPVLHGWVKRTRQTRQQAHLPAEKRRANMRAAFVWRAAPPGNKWGLVDDVLTTGATMASCIEALPPGIGQLVPIVLAHAERDVS